MLHIKRNREGESTRKFIGSILIGTDSEDIKDLGLILHAKGYGVTDAGNTREIISGFNTLFRRDADEETRLELVVLGLTSLKWANLAMLEYIRKLDWIVPVIVIGEFLEVEIKEAVKLGATVVVEYPFDLRALSETVFKAIPRK